MSTDRLDRNQGQEAAHDAAQAPPTSVEPVAPQDPHAAGAAAPSQTELLQGNVSGSTQKGAAEQAQQLKEEMPGGTSGLHSTGSWTGTADK
jgi:ABC-type sugar transport system substrate-binding protein